MSQATLLWGVGRHHLPLASPPFTERDVELVWEVWHVVPAWGAFVTP